jgi:hypothetical protein
MILGQFNNWENEWNELFDLKNKFRTYYNEHWGMVYLMWSMKLKQT